MLFSVTQENHTAELPRVFICKWLTTIIGRAGWNVHHERVVDRSLYARTRNNAEPHLARVAVVKAHECHFTFNHQNPLQIWYLDTAGPDRLCWASSKLAMQDRKRRQLEQSRHTRAARHRQAVRRVEPLATKKRRSFSLYQPVGFDSKRVEFHCDRETSCRIKDDRIVGNP